MVAVTLSGDLIPACNLYDMHRYQDQSEAICSEYVDHRYNTCHVLELAAAADHWQ